jgi:hypothetical protein
MYYCNYIGSIFFFRPHLLSFSIKPSEALGAQQNLGQAPTRAPFIMDGVCGHNIFSFGSCLIANHGG